MNSTLKVRKAAERDFAQAARWYERQRDGLGREFVSHIELVLRRIEQYPLQNAVTHRDIRRALANRFPFGVFCRIEGDVVLAVAILHLSREPGAWQRRG